MPKIVPAGTVRTQMFLIPETVALWDKFRDELEKDNAVDALTNGDVISRAFGSLSKHFNDEIGWQIDWTEVANANVSVFGLPTEFENSLQTTASFDVETQNRLKELRNSLKILFKKRSIHTAFAIRILLRAACLDAIGLLPLTACKNLPIKLDFDIYTKLVKIANNQGISVEATIDIAIKNFVQKNCE